MLHFEMAKAAGDGDPLGVQAGKTLGEIAERRGLKQNQVAVYAGLPASTVHNYFTGGTKKPSLTYILKLCTALDVKLEQVLGFSPMPDIRSAMPDDRLGRLEATVEEMRQLLLQTDPRKRPTESRPAPAKSAADDRKHGTTRRRRATGGA